MAKRAGAANNKAAADKKDNGKLWKFLGLGSRQGIFSAFRTEKESPQKQVKQTQSKSKPLLALASHISVDCVIFGYDASELKVLLTVQKNDALKTFAKPGRNKLALPGDAVQAGEDFDEAARRISREVTGVENIFLEQLRTLGEPGKLERRRDVSWLPIKTEKQAARIIKVAYFAIINLKDLSSRTGATEPGLKWYPINKIPRLAADNNQTLLKALETLRFKLKYFPLVFELLPKKFTLGEAQALYEAISGKKLDKRNFRRKVSNHNLLTPLAEKQQQVAHKPALLYVFNFKAYEKLVKDTSPFAVF